MGKSDPFIYRLAIEPLNHFSVYTYLQPGKAQIVQSVFPSKKKNKTILRLSVTVLLSCSPEWDGPTILVLVQLLEGDYMYTRLVWIKSLSICLHKTCMKTRLALVTTHSGRWIETTDPKQFSHVTTKRSLKHTCL